MATNFDFLKNAASGAWEFSDDQLASFSQIEEKNQATKAIDFYSQGWQPGGSLYQTEADWINPRYRDTQRTEYTRFDTDIYGRGVENYENYAQGATGFDAYQEFQTGKGSQIRKDSEYYLNEWGIPINEASDRAKFESMDLALRLGQAKNQRPPRKFGVTDLLGLALPIVGGLTANPWLAAAGGAAGSAVKGGDLTDILKSAAFAGGGTYLGGKISDLFSGGSSIPPVPVGFGGSSGIQGVGSLSGAGGLSTAQGAGFGAAAGRFAGSPFVNNAARIAATGGESALTLAGSGGASIGHSPLAVLGGAEAANPIVAGISGQLGQFAGTNQVVNENQIIGPAPKNTNLIDLLKAGGDTINSASDVFNLFSSPESSGGGGGFGVESLISPELFETSTTGTTGTTTGMNQFFPPLASSGGGSDSFGRYSIYRGQLPQLMR